MDKTINSLIQDIAKTNDEVYSLRAKIDAYDEAENTIDVTPINGKAPILSVPIIAGASETPLLLTPKVGSFCIVTFLSKDNAFASMFSELESVSIRGDQFGGLIKIEELKSELAKVTARIDALYSGIQGATITPADGGASFKAGIIAAISGVPKENYSNIENENVKHG